MQRLDDWKKKRENNICTSKNWLTFHVRYIHPMVESPDQESPAKKAVKSKNPTPQKFNERIPKTDGPWNMYF